MTEIEQQIITAIIEMVRDGGKYAVFGLVMWFIYQLARIGLIGGLIWMIIKYIVACIVSLYRIDKDISSTKITLISKECSDNLKQAMEDMTQQIHDLQGCFGDLKCSQDEQQCETKKQTND